MSKKNSDKYYHFKDMETINHRNKEDYLKNIIKLENKILEATEKGVESVFINKTLVTDKEHTGQHCKCGMKKNDSPKITEKRICRCMYYYNKDQIQCSNCPLKNKYKNISSDYDIIEAEIPTTKVIKKCGGIDLVIAKKDNLNIKYAVEVKPKYSKETIVRMIAEIYTYTAEPEFKKYKKAIAFFEDSLQEKDYENFKNDQNFKNIIKDINIFKFCEKENKNGIIGFEIVKIK